MAMSNFEMKNCVPTVPTAPTKLLTIYKSISYIEISSKNREESVGNGRNTLEEYFIVLQMEEQKTAYMAKFPTVGTVGTKGRKYIYQKIVS